MNAAARVIHQDNIFTGHWLAMRLSKGQGVLVSLASAVLVTALVIVYVTNEYRLALSESEQLEKQAHEIRLEGGQLLLEQAALSTPSRVEGLAGQKLNMHLPAKHALVVLRVER